MTDDNGYPTDEDLATLRTLADGILDTHFAPLLEHLKAIWWKPGMLISWNPDTGALELHTGGWSGNEEIMGVLRETFFWASAWRRIERGGHYYFEVSPVMRGNPS